MNEEQYSDIDYARDICEGKQKSTQKFIMTISEKVKWKAKEWNKSTSNNTDFYWTQEKNSVSKEDDINNDWVWLLKKMINATCNYTGKN